MSAAPKFTPGPWTLDTVTCNSGRNKLALSNAKRRMCDISVFDEEDHANAKLMRAAPELYEELRLIAISAEAASAGFLKKVDLQRAMTDIATRARAALAKVRA